MRTILAVKTFYCCQKRQNALFYTTMGVGSGGQGGRALTPWIFKHGTNVVNRGLKVLFFGLLLLFFGLFSVAPP